MLFLFYLFLLFRAMPMAHGSSQVRGQIRAAAASLHHSHSNAPDGSPICDLRHSSGQRQILNPLNDARDQTHILMGTSGFLTH